MMEKLIDKVLDQFKGPDLWIVLAFAAIWVAGSLWFRSNNKEKKHLRRQILLAVTVLAIAAGVITIRHSVLRENGARRYAAQYAFPPNVAGILLLQIAGDESGSLQRHLVSSLNTELSREDTGQTIEVRAVPERVDESTGFTNAHHQARAVGNRFGAKLVVWGSRVGEKAFHPRI